MTARAGLMWLLLVSVAPAADGRLAARKACAMCHVFPEPELLDRESWRVGVLPRMGGLLGVTDVIDEGAPEGTYPEVPLVTVEEWEAIEAYYLAAAPEALPVAGRVEAGGLGGWFEVERVGRGGGAATTAVAVDEEGQVIVVGDAGGKRLVIYSEDLEVVDTIGLGGVPVEVRVEGRRRYLVTVIGAEVGPNHRAEGKVVRVEGGGVPRLLADGLARPVSAVTGDWNGDGGEDLVVCCFGFARGGLKLLSSGKADGAGGRVRGAGAGRFVMRLVDQPGAMAFAKDSGLLLMAQGDERVVRVGQIGRLTGVEETTVLRFPPSYGSSSMTEADLDRDGDLDLVITAGDNGDETPVFKPYHGVYVYENDGDGGYGEVAFFPMHGAYGSVAGDFDGDGDLDLGAVAYFADYAAGDAGFVVLENEGKWRFRARTVVGAGRLGRFAVVAAGDVDGDDDVDVVLGNFPGGPTGPGEIGRGLMEGWMAGGSITVLRNLSED